MAEAIKSRTPKCARCRNHGYTVNVKGHKGFCPHKSCTCDLCGLVKERQEVSKRQIKLRRQQHQEEMMGMYVPVPPSIFSQGSVCGINLDYLRVVFPRKRVDRLYAVLLEYNNDVNAAAAKLQQEENMGGPGDSQNYLTKNTVQQVRKINKATQWTPDTPPPKSTTTTMTTTAAASGGDAGHPAVRDNAHHHEPQSKARGKEEDDLHHHHHHQHQQQQQQPGSVSHCMFPYCWPSQSVPAQYAPSQSSLSQPPDLFRALSSRPQGGLFGSEPPPFLMGCSVPSDALASMLSCGPAPGPGSGPGPDPDPGAKRVAATAAGMAGLNEDSRLSGSSSPVPTSAAAQHQQQDPASWSISDVDVSELDLGNPGGNVSPSQYMSLASKLSQGGGGGVGGGGSAGQACGTGPSSSSSSSSSSWPDVPCPVAPMQRMIVPFGLPPPSLLTLPPGWGPPRPLPYLPAPHNTQGFYHPAPAAATCERAPPPAAFFSHASPTNLPDSSTLSTGSAEVASSLQPEEPTGHGLGSGPSPIAVEHLDAAVVEVEMSDKLDAAKREEDKVTISGDAVKIIVNDDSGVLGGVCEDAGDEFIDPSGF